MRQSSVLALLGAVALAVGASADVVQLQSGATLEGDLRKSPDGWVLTLENGSEMQLPAEQVKSVELRPRNISGTQGAAIAKSRLDSLRRSTEATVDPRVAAEKYRDFARQYKGTEAATLAQREADTWQARVDQGLIRQGDHWVTPERGVELQNEATARAAEARALMKAGREAEAVPVVEAVLKIDPGNISGLYLKGVLAHRADSPNEAKRAWEAVAGQIRSHAPTLNNLAVVSWRQNRFIDALGLYDQAMSAHPEDPTILANVAEALNGLSKDLREGQVAQRVYRRYAEQDQALSKRMAEQGLYRWGNQYVTREQMAEIEAKEKEIQGQLDALAGRFGQLEGRIRELDLQGEQNDRSLRQLEAARWQRDWNDKLIWLPLPQVYFEIQDDNARLRSERADAVNQLERLRRNARELQQQLPRARFSGMQNIIGVEGTPTLIASAAGEPAPRAEPAPAPAPPAPAFNAEPPAPAPEAPPLRVTVGPSTRPTTKPAP